MPLSKKLFAVLLIIFIFSGLGILLLQDKATNKPTVIKNKENVVTVSKQYACESSNCFELAVACENLETITANVKVTKPATESRAAVILTTSGTGKELYSLQSSNAAETVSKLLAAGTTTYEITWPDDLGWASHAEGAGFNKASCRLAEVAKWIATKDSASKLCAHGNSEGALQLSYGMLYHQLEKILDTVVLSGGPTLGRLDAACFTHPEFPNAKLAGEQTNKPLIDYLLGWREVGDYCTLDNPESNAILIAKGAGLVTENPKADYFYDTNMIFINTEDETNADEQGRLYYENIGSGKEWIKLSGTRHDVINTSEGAERIATTLIRECLN